jgi:hypothetical protein
MTYAPVRVLLIRQTLPGLPTRNCPGSSGIGDHHVFQAHHSSSPPGKDGIVDDHQNGKTLLVEPPEKLEYTIRGMRCRDSRWVHGREGIGAWWKALIQGSMESGVPIDLLLPNRERIKRVIKEEECSFLEGSLSMDVYLVEFCDRLIEFRNSIMSTLRNRSPAFFPG